LSIYFAERTAVSGNQATFSKIFSTDSAHSAAEERNAELVDASRDYSLSARFARCALRAGSRSASARGCCGSNRRRRKWRCRSARCAFCWLRFALGALRARWTLRANRNLNRYWFQIHQYVNLKVSLLSELVNKLVC
jgi:hypothetical protein